MVLRGFVVAKFDCIHFNGDKLQSIAGPTRVSGMSVLDKPDLTAIWQDFYLLPSLRHACIHLLPT